MFSFMIFMMAAPCLLALMSAIALFIVHRSLSRVRHALVWSAAFALTAVRWAMLAAMWPSFRGDFGMTLLFDLLGLVAMLLFAEGFRLRSGTERPIPTIVGCLGLPAVLIAAAFPLMPIRSALIPFISIVLAMWAAFVVVPRQRPGSVAEYAVIGMLVALSLLHAAGVVEAIAEQAGLIRGHGLFLATYMLALAPATAATGLFTLLLIAFDSSAELRRLTHTDPLTGVLNRLGIEQAALRAIERARRRTLSLVIADIDAFKGINDREGHAAGDATLIGFARHLADGLQRDEAVGRIGGEEFILLFPGCDCSAALARVEPVREGLAELRLPDLPDLKVTASFGIAEHRPGATLAETIERADAALYRSKREGRNRSTLAEPVCA